MQHEATECVCVCVCELFIERSSFFEGILQSIFAEGPACLHHFTSRGVLAPHAKRENAAV